MFDDPAVEINELTSLIKQDIQGLNGALTDLSTFQSRQANGNRQVWRPCPAPGVRVVERSAVATLNLWGLCGSVEPPMPCVAGRQPVHQYCGRPACAPEGHHCQLPRRAHAAPGEPEGAPGSPTVVLRRAGEPAVPSGSAARCTWPRSSSRFVPCDLVLHGVRCEHVAPLDRVYASLLAYIQCWGPGLVVGLRQQAEWCTLPHLRWLFLCARARAPKLAQQASRERRVAWPPRSAPVRLQQCAGARSTD